MLMSNDNKKAKLTYTSKLFLRILLIIFKQTPYGEAQQITCGCDPVGFQLQKLQCIGITRLRLVL
jgi:hypothetical protein